MTCTLSFLLLLRLTMQFTVVTKVTKLIWSLLYDSARNCSEIEVNVSWLIWKSMPPIFKLASIGQIQKPKFKSGQQALIFKNASVFIQSHPKLESRLSWMTDWSQYKKRVTSSKLVSDADFSKIVSYENLKPLLRKCYHCAVSVTVILLCLIHLRVHIRKAYPALLINAAFELRHFLHNMPLPLTPRPL